MLYRYSQMDIHERVFFKTFLYDWFPSSCHNYGIMRVLKMDIDWFYDCYLQSLY